MPVNKDFYDWLCEEVEKGEHMHPHIKMIVSCPICQDHNVVMIPTNSINLENSVIVGMAVTYFDCHICKGKGRQYRHELTMTIATKAIGVE